MAQNDRMGAANLHGLARVQRERRWTSIMDAVIAVSVLVWIAGLAGFGPSPTGARWVLPAVIGVMIVHRVLVAFEGKRRQRPDLAVRRQPTAAEAPQDAHAA